MALARRTEIAALRNCLSQGSDLVQRIGYQAKYAGTLRSKDREIPDLGDSWRWRRRTQHDGNPGRQYRDGLQRGQQGGSSRNQIGHRLGDLAVIRDLSATLR